MIINKRMERGNRKVASGNTVDNSNNKRELASI
jgi:hypothetical protein